MLSSRALLLPLTFLLTFHISSDFPLNNSPGGRISTSLVSGAIASVGEPDWSIAKADLVNYFYSYEPYEPGREYRSLFPFFRQPQNQQKQQNQQQIQQQSQNQNNQNKPNPTLRKAYPLPGPPFQPLGGPGTSYLPQPLPLQNPQNQQIQQNQQQIQQNPQNSQQNQPIPDSYLPQNPPISYQPYAPPEAPPIIKLQDAPSPPKYTKFGLTDKKTYPRYPIIPPLDLPDITTSKPLLGPVYEHPTQTTTAAPITTTITSTKGTTTIIPTVGPGIVTQPPGYYQYNNDPLSKSSSVDSQTIIWPQNVEENLTTRDDETQVRFLVHKPGDEEVIKSALVEDSKERNQDVKFIEGPMLRIQRHQKVYLPPKKKTVVYILLKEPQITTNVEVVGPTEEPAPEVFITYQKSDGAIRTKHYSPEVVKSDKYLSQLRSSATSALMGDFQNNNNNNQNNNQNNNNNPNQNNNYPNFPNQNQNQNIPAQDAPKYNSFNIDELQGLQHSASEQIPVQTVQKHTRSVPTIAEQNIQNSNLNSSPTLVMCPTSIINPSSSKSNPIRSDIPGKAN